MISFVSLLALTMVSGAVVLAIQEADAESLKQELKAQYASIERIIAVPPSVVGSASREEWRVALAQWQGELAYRFGQAADTVEKILQTNPPQPELWRERLETLRLYAQPISPPDRRIIYGPGEVQKRVHILDAPAVTNADEARAAKVDGDVRLRMVLAADGTVRHIFPIKSLSHGATEAAIEAARQIRFEPASRNGQPASQFVTLVYEFRNGRSSRPRIPKTVF
jgi:TonB family protein